jgi:hypothetical protein
MLFLVKPVQPAETVVSAAKISGRGWVDPMFPVMTAEGKYETRLMAKNQADMMERMLLTGMMAGTVVKTGLSDAAPKRARRRRNATPR